MPEHARNLHIEWKAIDDVAFDLERTLKAKWDEYFTHGGEPPSQQLLDDAIHARKAAAEKLALLIEYIEQSARRKPPESS